VSLAYDVKEGESIMGLLPKFSDARRCSKCNAPAEQFMESVFRDGKYTEQVSSVDTHTGTATHLCTAECGCLRFDQTYRDAALVNVRECVDDPFDERFVG